MYVDRYDNLGIDTALELFEALQIEIGMAQHLDPFWNAWTCSGMLQQPREGWNDISHQDLGLWNPTKVNHSWSPSFFTSKL